MNFIIKIWRKLKIKKMLKRFKITHHNCYRTRAFGFLIELVPPAIKCKYGHWRTEIAESLRIHILVWEFTIYFDLSYWEHYCKIKNSA
ncbi:MAG TPA: hypothetical protein DHM42_09860 [Clostridiales bacterium]|nr:hypothetical protein [Clostridiales bacterium]